MSILSRLKPTAGHRKKVKRLGRGDASGHGGTSTKGHKGQLARSSSDVSRGFEGGQMPLHRRSPKWGFTNISKRDFNIVNLDDIEKCFKAGDEVSVESCKAKGLVRKRNAPLKLLARGSLTKKVTVKVAAASGKAKEAVEKASGTLSIVA